MRILCNTETGMIAGISVVDLQTGICRLHTGCWITGSLFRKARPGNFNRIRSCFGFIVIIMLLLVNHVCKNVVSVWLSHWPPDLPQSGICFTFFYIYLYSEVFKYTPNLSLFLLHIIPYTCCKLFLSGFPASVLLFWSRPMIFHCEEPWESF